MTQFNTNITNREALKQAILELLRSDWEFRRAVAAELGLLEILERLERIEERMARIEERLLKVEERLEEHARAIRSLQEQVKRLQEQMLKLQEQVVRHTKAISELQRLVNIVAHRFGVITESALRETMRTVIEEILGVGEVSKLTVHDEEGLVYGYPCDVDIDVIIRDKQHVIIEVKSRVDPGDVRIAALKAKLYEKIYGVKPRVLIVGGFISPKAYEAAVRLGVEIKPAVSEE